MPHIRLGMIAGIERQADFQKTREKTLKSWGLF
jgi:hypothetical protein